MKPEKPVTQEFVIRIILKTVAWIVFLAAAVAVGLWFESNIKKTNEILDMSGKANAKP